MEVVAHLGSFYTLYIYTIQEQNTECAYKVNANLLLERWGSENELNQVVILAINLRLRNRWAAQAAQAAHEFSSVYFRYNSEFLPYLRDSG